MVRLLSRLPFLVLLAALPMAVACTRVDPPSSREVYYRDFDFTVFSVVLDQKAQSQLSSFNKQGSKEVTPMQVATRLEGALRESLVSPGGRVPVYVDTTITELTLGSYPARLAGNVRLLDAQKRNVLRQYSVTARYGEPGLFKRIGLSIVDVVTRTNTIGKLSELFAEEVKKAVEPVPGIPTS